MSEQYHIRCREGDVGRYVLLPGDPGRSTLIASYFENARLVMQNREYTTYTGTLDGVPVSVTSTGIGAASTAIAVEELRAIGADTLIRVGTCGAMQNFLHTGDLVIAQGAVRDEGASTQYVPLSYPAVAHLDTITALQVAAREQGVRFFTGIVRSSDALYADLVPQSMPLHYLTGGSAGRMWSEAGVLCADMEASALFVIGTIRGMRTGTVLQVVNATGEGAIAVNEAGQHALDPLIRTAVSGLRALIRADAAIGAGRT